MATLFGVYVRTKKKKKKKDPQIFQTKTIEKNNFKEVLFVRPTLNFNILKENAVNFENIY